MPCAKDPFTRLVSSSEDLTFILMQMVFCEVEKRLLLSRVTNVDYLQED
ncbi:hypothetical protein ACU8KH_06029 [Lachancea thermotolerans]